MNLVDITKDEWVSYVWERIAGSTIFLRGIKKTQPPDDGYVYVEVTTFGDTEQKWARAKQYSEDEGK